MCDSTDLSTNNRICLPSSNKCCISTIARGSRWSKVHRANLTTFSLSINFFFSEWGILASTKHNTGATLASGIVDLYILLFECDFDHIHIYYLKTRQNTARKNKNKEQFIIYQSACLLCLRETSASRFAQSKSSVNSASISNEVAWSQSWLYNLWNQI